MHILTLENLHNL